MATDDGQITSGSGGRSAGATPPRRGTAYAQALFTSDLSAHHIPSQDEVIAAIRRAIRAHGGIGGCAGEVAAAYGDHPDTAPSRMRWARDIIDSVYREVNGCQGTR